MPSAPHDYAENYFADLVTDMRDAAVLMKQEAKSIKRRSKDFFLPRHSDTEVPGELGPASRKVPDVAFGPREGCCQPYIVVELGFSQPYDDPKRGGLLQDAKHWLEQTEGDIRCVVLVCIEEGKKLGIAAPEDEAHMTEGCDSDHAEASDRESMHSSDSCIAEYKRHYLRFASSPTLVGRHAGPLSAFAEVWRYDSAAGKMLQSGPRVVLPPLPLHNPRE